EAVFGTRAHERALTLAQLEELAFHVERAAALEDDVHLVVVVRLLAVRLRRDEHVHAEFEARRLVHDLVAAAGRRQALLRPEDLHAVSGDCHGTSPSGCERTYNRPGERSGAPRRSSVPRRRGTHTVVFPQRRSASAP